MDRIVIVGAGQAGLQVAESLRGSGFDGELTMVGAEPHGPYARPPLSKEGLTGRLDPGQTLLRSPVALARKRIGHRPGTSVTALDRTRREVLLDDGTRLRYDGLALATGARPRTLRVPGAEADRVVRLRTRADAELLGAALDRCAASGEPLVVIGGGFIGLEVAAAARRRTVPVTVLEASPRLLSRVLAPAASRWSTDLHRGHGVEVVVEAAVVRITTRDGVATGAELADGRWFPAGLVLVGVGAEPEDGLARAAGLRCDRGIVVDSCARTDDPAVVAAGDCTVTRLADGTVRRPESVQNAVEQGKSAAAALLGRDRPFTATPWFWSHQYDATVQIAGLSAGADAWAVRGRPESGAFSVFHYRGATLLAVDSVNATEEHLLARRLLDRRVPVPPEQAGDVGVDLAALLVGG